MKKEIVDFLLNHADPSIVLRVKKEVLGDLSREDENALIGDIILQKNVQTVLKSQQADGWFGNGFHGQSPTRGVGIYNNMEVGLRYLAEKGLPPENDFIRRAVQSFLIREPFDPTYGMKRPETPETDYQYTASGLYLARSSIIIRAGYEEVLPKNGFINLAHDIDLSLKTFANVSNYAAADDVIDRHRKKPCFEQGALWPCLYHLRMLAHSHGWRNEKNAAALADGVSRLLSFEHSDEMVYTYKKGQYVGPCFAFINSQYRILGLDTMGSRALSLDILELFARCGIVQQVSVLKSKYNHVLSLVDNSLNTMMSVNRRRDHDWSPYFGFALEETWRNKINVQCDILFRILLIIHYAEDSR